MPPQFKDLQKQPSSGVSIAFLTSSEAGMASTGENGGPEVFEGCDCTKTSLLDLPTEVRRFIYVHLFAQSYLKMHVRDRPPLLWMDKLSCFYQDHNTFHHFDRYITSRRYHYQITLTCHQLRTETLLSLYTSTTNLCRVETLNNIIPALLLAPVLSRIRELRISMQSPTLVWSFEQMPSLQRLYLDRTLDHSNVDVDLTIEDYKLLFKRSDLREKDCGFLVMQLSL